MSGDPPQFPYLPYQYFPAINVGTTGHIDFGFSEETLRLAQRIAAFPPPSNDEKEIEEWAKRLAADLCRFTD